MTGFWDLVRQVLTPGGSAEFRAHLSQLTEEQRRLARCLRVLDDPAIKGINAASNAAADFETQE